MKLQSLLLLAALPALAQSYQRHQIYGGMGAAVPRDELKPYYNSAFSWSFGYGYRFLRNFQADVALDTAYKAANVNDFLNTSFGPLRIRDFEFFLPMGGRVVLPLERGKVEFYGGGGGAWLKYAELLRQPSQFFRVDCISCTSRSGWGYYALLGGSVALDRDQHFRLGAFTRVYQGHTDGSPIGGVPAVRTSDRWINTYGTFIFSF